MSNCRKAHVVTWQMETIDCGFTSETRSRTCSDATLYTYTVHCKHALYVHIHNTKTKYLPMSINTYEVTLVLVTVKP